MFTQVTCHSIPSSKLVEEGCVFVGLLFPHGPRLSRRLPPQRSPSAPFAVERLLQLPASLLRRPRGEPLGLQRALQGRNLLGPQSARHARLPVCWSGHSCNQNFDIFCIFNSLDFTVMIYVINCFPKQDFSAATLTIHFNK